MFEVPLDIQLLQHIQGTIVLVKYKQNPDPLNDKSGNKKQNKQTAVYRPADFDYDPATHTCVCPAGKTLYGNGSHCVINGFNAIKFQGAHVPNVQSDKGNDRKLQEKRLAVMALIVPIPRILVKLVVLGEVA